MPDGQQSDRLLASEGVSKFAIQALAQVLPLSAVPRPPLESYLSQMFDAACAPDRQALSDVVRSMRKARVSATQIAEVYIPTIARRLGDAWVADTLGFGGTSIGSARLQGLLWELRSDWGTTEDSITRDRPSYLVGVPHGVQHTLGATILAGHLRRRGMSVCLNLGLTPEIMRQESKYRDFHGILLSAYGIQHLESLQALIVEARQSGRGTPVIVGGHILEQPSEIQALVQADLLTSDADAAIAHCDRMRADQTTGPVARAVR